MTRRYTTYICDLAYREGETPLVNRHQECPASATHTPEPTGYIAWHEWARLMAKTHRSTRCPACGLWVIWVPKVKKVIAFPEPTPAVSEKNEPAE